MGAEWNVGRQAGGLQGDRGGHGQGQVQPRDRGQQDPLETNPGGSRIREILQFYKVRFQHPALTLSKR